MSTVNNVDRISVTGNGQAVNSIQQGFADAVVANNSPVNAERTAARNTEARSGQSNGMPSDMAYNFPQFGRGNSGGGANGVGQVDKTTMNGGSPTLSNTAQKVAASALAGVLAKAFSEDGAMPSLSAQDRKSMKAELKEALSSSPDRRADLKSARAAVQVSAKELGGLLGGSNAPLSAATKASLNEAADMFDKIGRSDLAGATRELLSKAPTDDTDAELDALLNDEWTTPQANTTAPTAPKAPIPPTAPTAPTPPTAITPSAPVSPTDGVGNQGSLTAAESKLLGSTLANSLINQTGGGKGIPTTDQLNTRRAAEGLPPLTTEEAANYTAVRDSFKIGAPATAEQTKTVEAAERDILEKGNIKQVYLPAMEQASALLKASKLPDSVKLAEALDGVIAAAKTSHEPIEVKQPDPIA